MHDKNDEIIYVGKAKNLKNRVSQYFQSGKAHTIKVKAMVSNIADFSYVVVANEYEAFALENNLIKRYQPFYNILLKEISEFLETEEIKNNDYNLNISRYVSTASVEEPIDLFEVSKELEKIDSDIKKAKDKHNQFLRELGLPEIK